MFGRMTAMDSVMIHLVLEEQNEIVNDTLMILCALRFFNCFCYTTLWCTMQVQVYYRMKELWM